jgi:Glu-tRNA(Gln) amidotransferase subunit E-like FAD-binding protein
MSEELDYSKLKFKCGLEIHQQLDTKKLFCDCPSLLRKDEPDFVVERKLHAVAGESGEIDVAAKHEAEKDKSFVYEVYDTNCLIELDEEPPHEINKKSLKIALQIALLLNCKIIPLTQIMRKTVIDGSNTSGFQRTVLIARNGYVETSFGKVEVESICLEEDSARRISEKNNKIVFRLDRLGIPLVEITTAPDIKNAEQAKEAALKIGDILRSCKVKRGIGTIRQDVNISIREENRVELKGVQDMKVFLKTIDNEILRQKKLSDSKNPTKKEVRNALANGDSEFLRPMPGSARMYPETDLPLLKISRDFINECKKDLPKLKSNIQEELEKKGLDKDMIKLLFKRNRLEEFKNLVEVFHKPSLIVKMILIFPKEIARKIGKSLEDVENILEDFYGDILNALEKEKISEGDIKDIMKRIVEGENFDEIIKKEKIDVNEIEEKILKIIKEKPGLSSNAYMGLVMKEMKGKISGKEVMGIIGKILK